MSKLERYTVSMDSELFAKFDQLIRARGYNNRSEAIRDLIRASLVEEKWAGENAKVAATVTMVYDHHAADVGDQLTHLQHHAGKSVVATTHVHLDNDNCLEVVILRGRCKEVRQLAERMVALKGIKHGKIAFSAEGADL